MEVESVEKPKIYFSGKVYCRREMDMITALLQQGRNMNLYTFNKVSWCTGYDNKGQHFEKWVSATESYDNKT